MYDGHRMSSTNAGLPPPDLNHREHSKNYLSGETDRPRRRAVTGKLIPERSTEYGTQPDLSQHQHQEGDQAHQ